VSEPGRQTPRWIRRIFRQLFPGRRGFEVLEDLDREYLEFSARHPRGLGWGWCFAQLLRPDTWRLALALRRVRRIEESRQIVGRGPELYSLAIPWLDLRLGLRMLVKHPGLTAVAVFALGVGIPIGLAPAHVGRVHETTLPVDGGRRISVLRYVDPATGHPQSPFIDDFAHWRDRLTSFATVAFTSIRRHYNLVTDGGLTVPVQGAAVTPSFFDTLRVPPLLGRPLVPADDLPGAAAVVVISYDLWQSAMNADPAVIGRTARIGGVPRSVVGVMPEGFRFPYRDRLWLPLQGNVGAGEALPYPGAGWLVFGRLEHGVAPEEAEAEFSAVRDRWANEFSEQYARLLPQVVPFTIGLYGHSRLGALAEPQYLLLQILGLLVLVATCANVGMVVFARTAARTSEMAVRTALGASRRRIASQLVVESLVVAVLAAGGGLLLADRAASRNWPADPFWAAWSRGGSSGVGTPPWRRCRGCRSSWSPCSSP
jgi:putative ABC transport system permease protein